MMIVMMMINYDIRYQCEGRGAGALQGQHSSQDRKTYPRIQLVGTSKYFQVLHSTSLVLTLKYLIEFISNPSPWQVGTTRRAVVVVSCVTHDSDPPRAHPHNLVSPASVSTNTVQYSTVQYSPICVSTNE